MAVLNRREAARYRASKHASRATTMPCGRVVHGNGGQHSHQNRCRACLEADGAYLPERVRDGIRLNMEWATAQERIAAYAEWKRSEGDRLLGELGKA